MIYWRKRMPKLEQQFSRKLSSKTRTPPVRTWKSSVLICQSIRPLATSSRWRRSNLRRTPTTVPSSCRGSSTTPRNKSTSSCSKPLYFSSLPCGVDCLFGAFAGWRTHQQHQRDRQRRRRPGHSATFYRRSNSGGGRERAD
jgi:hypothetical protein